MKGNTEYFLYFLAIFIGGYSGWYFDVGMWSSYGWTWYQTNIMLGVTAALVGIFVILKQLDNLAEE